ncbi:MAG: N-acetylglucosamine kinase [Pirellulaceae bacterium]|nr:N-acetylglucosamine kinase [Pirellulaceae bacterium]
MSEQSIGSERLLLGADGGGTKTVVWLARSCAGGPSYAGGPWEVLGRGLAGTGNPRAAGFEVVQANLRAAIDAAFADAGLPRATVDAACFGLAGAGRVAEQAAIADWAHASGVAQQVQVVGDLELILPAGDSAAVGDDGPGIALVAGTGSVALGRGQSGAAARCGGWGYLLGDEGSGYALGLAALRSAVRSVDGRGPATSLLAAVQQALSAEEPADLIAKVYAVDMTRQRIASLAPLVFAAEATDPLARSIVEGAASDLAEMVAALAAKLPLKAGGYRLAMAGGLFVHQPSYRERVVSNLCERQIGPRDTSVVADPVRGAVHLAFQMAVNQAAKSAGEVKG